MNERFYSFWNHGATSGELHWEMDLTAYFWTTPKKLLKALTNARLFKMLNDADQLRENDYDGWTHCCKGIKGGFLPQARIDAQEEYDALTAEGATERNQWRYHSERCYSEILEVSAERPDEANKQTDWNTSHTTLMHRLGFKH